MEISEERIREIIDEELKKRWCVGFGQDVILTGEQWKAKYHQQQLKIREEKEFSKPAVSTD